ncbi:MAG: DNA (cytosine-5-)-methyltransferase [Candidatus Thorarchaeota archaeon]
MATDSMPHERTLWNHVAPPLSALDLEMVRAVPPGGDWRDIPPRIVAKSSRLRQISKSGGRTTYYGRLRSDMPSYTISTYFNRPGNGTFIHPTQDRTISLREAARLQSFPDSFRFSGPFSSILKQVGNAVPPLLARAVGETLAAGSTVDLFCGAGGLSSGLQQAGHKIMVAADVDPHMCQTYSLNHPGVRVLCRDMSHRNEYQEVLEEIENRLRGRTLSLLAGGPPCQGFSTAGWWNSADNRNILLGIMLRAVRDLMPEQVLIENVPGIKWIAGGTYLQRALSVLGELDYTVVFRVLHAEQYGVPQRRTRVIIVGLRARDTWDPPQLLFQAIPRGCRFPVCVPPCGLPFPVTVGEAIADLPRLVPGAGAEVVPYDEVWTTTEYQRLMRGKISFHQFVARRCL